MGIYLSDETLYFFVFEYFGENIRKSLNAVDQNHGPVMVPTDDVLKSRVLCE